MWTYVDDPEGLVNAALLVERVGSVHLSGDLARDNVQNLLAELDEEEVQSVLDLLVDVLALLLAVGDGTVHELRVLGLLGCGEDQRWVGGGILRLVLANGGEVTAVTDDGLESSVSKMTDRAFKARGGYRQPLIVRRVSLTVPVAFSWSREEDMISVMFKFW